MGAEIATGAGRDGSGPGECERFVNKKTWVEIDKDTATDSNLGAGGQEACLPSRDSQVIAAKRLAYSGLDSIHRNGLAIWYLTRTEFTEKMVGYWFSEIGRPFIRYGEAESKKDYT